LENKATRNMKYTHRGHPYPTSEIRISCGHP